MMCICVGCFSSPNFNSTWWKWKIDFYFSFSSHTFRCSSSENKIKISNSVEYKISNEKTDLFRFHPNADFPLKRIWNNDILFLFYLILFEMRHSTPSPRSRHLSQTVKLHDGICQRFSKLIIIIKIVILLNILHGVPKLLALILPTCQFVFSIYNNFFE